MENRYNNVAVLILHAVVMLQAFRISEGSASEFVHFSDPKTFSDAEADCVARGGNLASIHRLSENEEAEDTISGSEKLAWIGLGEVAASPFYAWTDGTDFDFFNFEQVGPFFEPCYVMDKDTEGQWFDSPCNIPYPYICRLDIDNGLEENQIFPIVAGGAAGIVGGALVAFFVSRHRRRIRQQRSFQENDKDYDYPSPLAPLASVSRYPQINKPTRISSFKVSNAFSAFPYGRKKSDQAAIPSMKSTGSNGSNKNNGTYKVPSGESIKSDGTYKIPSGVSNPIYAGSKEKNLKRGAISTLII
eukprot:CAMPEP_0204839912 /NCGR_PEP_ID=MMETSP1346-20131115/35804_1 /ASSEMBLY_ACC=CAM_ASM_000771 /TAXON_ID=215587 /ORGANISM="Aplanochytrium stocchinoi, Strain GSBS06" /LENGTH=301 /DNA_ID=CAMNT_0051976981 /DNA_START=235 /DNA_END=1140 /DNA_ORIENTATION=-